MEAGIEEIVGSVHKLNIADDGSQDRRQEPLRSTHSHPVSLQDAIHTLIQSTSTMISQAQSVKSLADDVNSSGKLPITEVCSLHEGIKKLANTTFNLQTTIDTLHEATERSVIIHLKSLGGQSPSVVFKILSHFDKRIRDIVREVLNNASDQEVLNNSPAGPTLFYPPASANIQSLNLDAVPRYLFRTFGWASSGRNDESVIASMASIIGSHESSRTDILLLERLEATNLLQMHLNKLYFDGEEYDNLFGGSGSANAARLTSRFARSTPGNFHKGNLPRTSAYSKHIIPLPNSWAIQNEKFDFRLENEDFYNGEYLSQGALNYTGRSCVVSLEDLRQAGLFELYPEFEDAEGRKEWTKRVLKLRRNWSAEQGATDRILSLRSN